ncbi:hypothetical protein BJV74DRAFT_925949 [Russula compacta]|nr:hypothetical protein BJV74DRAFT_925949 [Russula compacta]
MLVLFAAAPLVPSRVAPHQRDAEHDNTPREQREEAEELWLHDQGHTQVLRDHCSLGGPRESGDLPRPGWESLYRLGAPAFEELLDELNGSEDCACRASTGSTTDKKKWNCERVLDLKYRLVKACRFIWQGDGWMDNYVYCTTAAKVAPPIHTTFPSKDVAPDGDGRQLSLDMGAHRIIPPVEVVLGSGRPSGRSVGATARGGTIERSDLCR